MSLHPRDAAHALNEITTLLELRGENRFKAKAYATAARAILALNVEDIASLISSGELEKLAGIGPLTLDVLRDLLATGDSQFLEQLRENTPEGLLEMLRVPGLGTSRIHKIHEGLGIETLHDLERAARDGRLAVLPRFGARTSEKILKGIAYLRETGGRVLYPHAALEGERLLVMVRAHPDVIRAELAGSLRRRLETVGDIDVVAECRGSPARVAAALSHAPRVREVVGGGGPAITIRFEDGTRLDVRCVSSDRFALALWWATGNRSHCDAVAAVASARGVTIGSDAVRDRSGAIISIADEAAIYRAAGLAFIPPELREARGEIEAAGQDALPTLLTEREIRGVLHCHSHYSDGHGTIAELARAAQAHGWSYLGISDHSQSAFYAGGLTRDDVLRQHDEIEVVNATMQPEGFRVLKGIEADILPCGRVDYDAQLLDRFDYVIGSVHSRFGMNETQMTERVLKALDDPHVTIVGHPTGRLLLTREPYALDVRAVIERSGEVGVSVELNADPHRLDIDWRWLQEARACGTLVEIGPDAHSIAGLDNVALGVSIARKGWLEARDVLNARSSEDVLAQARARREGRAGTRATRPNANTLDGAMANGC
ncbi:MAG: DNA polymerase/3'-5' exonuclease PolX [Gemmatimonadaceae bacterium]